MPASPSIRAQTVGAFVCLSPKLIGLSDTDASHVYVHVTNTCPVCCPHCMYSSNDADERVVFHGRKKDALFDYLQEAHPTKLTISGGGEPFEDEALVLDLIANSGCHSIEIDTSGSWASDAERAQRIMSALDESISTDGQDVILRLSIDRFHLATGKVSLQTYKLILHTWERCCKRLRLCIRGLAVGSDETLSIFSDYIDATLRMRDEFGGLIEWREASIPVTRNVLRFSGRGRSLRNTLQSDTPRVSDYYREFLGEDVRLGVVINEAIEGEYANVGRPAPTVDYDGEIHLFAATPPDRRPNVVDYGYRASIRFFLEDPIVVFLLTHPIGSFIEMALRQDFERVSAIVDENDYCLLVEKILSAQDMLDYISSECLRILTREGIVALR